MLCILRHPEDAHTRTIPARRASIQYWRTITNRHDHRDVRRPRIHSRQLCTPQRLRGRVTSRQDDGQSPQRAYSQKRPYPIPGPQNRVFFFLISVSFVVSQFSNDETYFLMEAPDGGQIKVLLPPVRPSAASESVFPTTCLLMRCAAASSLASTGPWGHRYLRRDNRVGR